jgi:hypothetical protein
MSTSDDNNNMTTVAGVVEEPVSDESIKYCSTDPLVSAAAVVATTGSKQIKLAPWRCPLQHLQQQQQNQQPPTFRTGLKVLNSLTRRQDEFITMHGDKQVTWYM